MNQDISKWDIQSRSQITRKDLMLDDDEDIHNLDYLQVKPARPAFDIRSSDEMSQASSTVIHHVNGSDQENNTVTRLSSEALASMVNNTMDTDTLFQEKHDTITSAYQEAVPHRIMSSDINNAEPEDNFQDATLVQEDENAYSNGQEYPRDEDAYDYVDDGSDLISSPPASPPRELAPGRLYALFDFNGPDPSHLELYKDDPVELLNDSDSYWWLVRKNDNKVGFAPAEVLETYEERLARLNCWKNELIEKSSSATYLSADDLKEFAQNSSHKYSTISLNNNSTYGSNSDVFSGNINASDTSLMRKSSLKRRKSIIKKSVAFAPETLPQLSEQDDERSEVLSDIHNIDTPLLINKRLGNTNFIVKNLDTYIPESFGQNSDEDDDEMFRSGSEQGDDEYDEDDESTGLKTALQPSLMSNSTDSKNRIPKPTISIRTDDDLDGFAAPSATFMATQDSIGSYSPDSIDYTSDNQSSPSSLSQPVSFIERRERFLQQKKEKLAKLDNKKANIPLSTPRLDIASSMQMLDDLIRAGDEGEYGFSDYDDEEAAEVRVANETATKDDSFQSVDTTINIADAKDHREDADNLSSSRRSLSQDVSSNSSSLSLQPCTSAISSTSSTDRNLGSSDTPSTSTSFINNGSRSFLIRPNEGGVAEATDSVSTPKDSPDSDSNNTWPTNGSSYAVESHQENTTINTSVLETRDYTNLHPVTSELFDPLLTQMEQLESMLSEMMTQQ